MSLVLSLFPGIGMLDMAFALEGWQTVRGSDPIWGGDIRNDHYPAGVFQGVIGGPPCQSFSSLVHLVRANGHEPRFGNLIPEYERCVLEAQPAFFLMENVPQAPEPVVPGYGVNSFLLDNSMLNDGTGWGQEQRRVRRFSFGLRGVDKPPSLLRWIDLAVFVLPDAVGTTTQWTPDNNSQEAKGRTRHECINGSHGKPPSVRDKVRQPAVTSTDGGERPSERKTRKSPITAGHEQPDGITAIKRRKASVTSNVGGRGSDAVPQEGKAAGGKGRYKLADACRLQGLPEDFLKDAPFTADGKLKAVANGVPLFMGRAIARAVKCALEDSL